MAELQAENWNLKHAVGTPVVLNKDSGDFQTKTRSEAFVTSDGRNAVCFFEGVTGYYLLERATAQENQK